MLTILAGDAPRPWTDIPIVVITGAILGTLLLIAAIRAMSGKKK